MGRGAFKGESPRLARLSLHQQPTQQQLQRANPLRQARIAVYGGVSVGLMTWMMHAAPRAIEVATALYVGAFNIGIALGSWGGGQVVDGFGLIANLWLAGGFAGTALLLTLGVGLRDRLRDDALRPMPTDL